jgi:hypothetical protein
VKKKKENEEEEDEDEDEDDEEEEEGRKEGQGSTHTTCWCKKTCESAQFVVADELRQDLRPVERKSSHTVFSFLCCKSSSKM